MSAPQSVLSQIARPYANALFELAQETGRLEETERGLDSLSASLAESEDFSRLIESPAISSEDKAKAIEAVLARAGLPDLVANTLRIVARNGRLFTLPGIIRAFKALAAAARNEVTAEVVSATPLTDAQKTELSRVLADKIGKSVTVEAKVDESLIGGLVVKVGSKMIDTSLKTQLSAMKIAMKGVR